MAHIIVPKTASFLPLDTVLTEEKAPTLEECKCGLLSVLEGWILVGLKFGHQLPIVGNVDLNIEAGLRKER